MTEGFSVNDFSEQIKKSDYFGKNYVTIKKVGSQIKGSGYS